MNERSERCQKAVGHRLTIHTLDDIGHRQAIFLFKLRAYFFRQNTFIELVQKMLSEHPSTPFITEDIAQGRGILNNSLPIIKARISARP